MAAGWGKRIVAIFYVAAVIVTVKRISWLMTSFPHLCNPRSVSPWQMLTASTRRRPSWRQQLAWRPAPTTTARTTSWPYGSGVRLTGKAAWRTAWPVTWLAAADHLWLAISMTCVLAWLLWPINNHQLWQAALPLARQPIIGRHGVAVIVTVAVCGVLANDSVNIVRPALWLCMRNIWPYWANVIGGIIELAYNWLSICRVAHAGIPA